MAVARAGVDGSFCRAFECECHEPLHFCEIAPDTCHASCISTCISMARAREIVTTEAV